ncbi:MAG: hypothetical protein ABI699_19595 [Caldimonas sp.]
MIGISLLGPSAISCDGRALCLPIREAMAVDQRAWMTTVKENGEWKSGD